MGRVIDLTPTLLLYISQRFYKNPLRIGCLRGTKFNNMIKDIKISFENRESFYKMGDGTIVVDYISNGEPGDEKSAIIYACEKLSRIDSYSSPVRHSLEGKSATHKEKLPNGEMKCETKFEAEIFSK